MFAEGDDENAAQVVVINRAMLKKYWQAIDANPIGDFILVGKDLGRGFEDTPRQIVGVVAVCAIQEWIASRRCMCPKRRFRMG